MHTFRILLLLLLLTSCKKDPLKDHDFIPSEKRAPHQLGELLRPDKVGMEYLDSLSIKIFLDSTPHFRPYQKKLIKFYDRRSQRLAWSVEGEYLPQANMFINILRNMGEEGLEPEKYNPDMLLTMLLQTQDGRKDASQNIEMRKIFDLAMSASYFKYARQLWKGKVNPGEEGIKWFIERKKIKFGKTLDSILSAEHTDDPFRRYEPLHDQYHKLLDKIRSYEKIRRAGGFKKINLNENALKVGDRSEAVYHLKDQLSLTKDLDQYTPDSTFSQKVKEAVMRFQRRHGLKEDGLVGGNTLKKLNMPIEQRIKQMLVNLERWRWVPDSLGKDHILINIPDFSLRIFEHDEEVIKMKVIVGKQMTRTPIFNDVIQYIELNPYWHIPIGIEVDEILPGLKKDSAYTVKRQIEIFADHRFDRPIDPFTIDWDSVQPGQYKFRQRPGAYNALGSIKFMFPNSFMVYLHDTPQKHLFARPDRMFSHGCIRVEEPYALAEHLLRNDARWDKEKLIQRLGKEPYRINLDKNSQMPIFILYLTVWVEDDGTVLFMDDVYSHDQQLAKLIAE